MKTETIYGILMILMCLMILSNRVKIKNAIKQIAFIKGYVDSLENLYEKMSAYHKALEETRNRSKDLYEDSMRQYKEILLQLEKIEKLIQKMAVM